MAVDELLKLTTLNAQAQCILNQIVDAIRACDSELCRKDMVDGGLACLIALQEITGILNIQELKAIKPI